MLNASSGNVTTVMGSVSSGLNIYDVPATSAILGTITGLCVDPATHNVYCDEMSCSCRYLNLTTDSLYEVAGNFSSQSFTDDINACNANMNFPVGMCMDPSGNGIFYIADCGNNRVRKVFMLASKPTYAFGEKQTIDGCAGLPTAIDSQLALGTLDSTIAISWTMLTPPTHGSVTGLPAATMGVGVGFLNYPTGVTYTPSASFAATDFFQVVASAGVLTDTLTIYATSNCGYTTLVSGPGADGSKVSMYPNPAQDFVTLNSDHNMASIEVTNVLGQVVIFRNGNLGQNMVLDTHMLAKGVYQVTINGNTALKLTKD
jgi:hypothetical protein